MSEYMTTMEKKILNGNEVCCVGPRIEPTIRSTAEPKPTVCDIQIFFFLLGKLKNEILI